MFRDFTALITSLRARCETRFVNRISAPAFPIRDGRFAVGPLNTFNSMPRLPASST
jgi:hypothetical protein